jgi:hypothetical protein
MEEAACTENILRSKRWLLYKCRVEINTLAIEKVP